MAQGQTSGCVLTLVGKKWRCGAWMKDYQLAAKNWGADIELRVGQKNEAVIAEDFKAGKCDAN